MASLGEGIERGDMTVLLCCGVDLRVGEGRNWVMAGYRSFLFPGSEVSDSLCVLDARESHHLVRVFRARVGASVDLLDGKGAVYHGMLAKADAKAAQVQVESVERFERSKQSICLLQSMPKGKAMDLILRIATEIGVARVQPIFTDQGERQIKGERLESKMEKWRINMIESCKQCGLPFLPELAEPMDLADWLAQSSPAGLKVVASLEAGSQTLKAVLESADSPEAVVVAVGPEGDFSASEYTALRDSGFKPVRLGRYVLRAETAVAYLLSVVDQFDGDLD